MHNLTSYRIGMYGGARARAHTHRMVRNGTLASPHTVICLALAMSRFGDGAPFDSTGQWASEYESWKSNYNPANIPDYLKAFVDTTPPDAAAAATSTAVPAWFNRDIDDSSIAGLATSPGAVTEKTRGVDSYTGHYFWAPVRSSAACDAWLTPGVLPGMNENMLSHLPKNVHMCYTVTGWVQTAQGEDASPQCAKWYVNDAYRYGRESGVSCFTNKGTEVGFKGYSTIMELRQRHETCVGFLSNILSYNDIPGRADLDNPARTAPRVKLFEDCFLYHFCNKIPEGGEDGGGVSGSYKPSLHGFSQVGQDRWIIKQFGYKRGGTYIDIGASDGMEMSNTYLLDKCYGWSGLSVDANFRRYLGLSRSNRGGETLFGCVGNKDTMTEFQAAEGLSARVDVESSDHVQRVSDEGKHTEMYNVPCYHFGTLLERWYKFRQIAIVDYMTIDIEGAEYMALSSIDFMKTPIKVIGVEIHFSAADRVAELLQSKGYEKMSPHPEDLGDTFFKYKNVILN